MCTPWSVFQDGSDKSASAPAISHLEFTTEHSLSFALLVCYRSSTIFSLWWSLPPFALHYQTGVLSKISCLTGLSPCVGLYPKSLIYSIYNTNSLPYGLLSVHSPLLRKSLLVSSPPSNDMLKFKGCSIMYRYNLFENLYKLRYIQRIAHICVLNRYGSREIPCRWYNNVSL